MPRPCRLFALVALAALAAGGCETTTSPPIGDPPEEVNLTLTGTLTIAGSVTHRFTTTRATEINVRLQDLAPVDTVTIGLGLGEWTGASCNVRIADDEAIQNELLIGTGTAAGEFCARVYDVGRLTAPTEYTLAVRYFK
jgi:hypothetical protein